MATDSTGEVAGVVEEDFLAEAGVVDVDVDFGCGDAFVAEHLLDSSQVGSPFEQMCGEGVAQGMGRYGFAYACGFGKPANHDEHHLTGQRAATAAEKHDVACLGFLGHGSTAPLGVGFYRVDGHRRHRHHALFVTFAPDDEIALVE